MSANPQPTTFEIGDSVHGIRNRMVDVPISVNGNPDPGFAAVGFEINFSPQLLLLDKVELRSSGTNPPSDTLRLNNSTVIKPKDVQDGTQWISIANVDNLRDWTGDGVLLNLTFEIVAPEDVTRATVDMTFTSDPNGRPASNSTGELVLNAAMVNGGRGSVIISTSSVGPPGQRPPGAFGVTINNGGTGSSGSGWNQPNATVNINAGTAPTGQQFSHWTASPTVTFANANNATTTFTMPSNDVTLTAHWVPIASPSPSPTASPTASPTGSPGATPTGSPGATPGTGSGSGSGSGGFGNVPQTGVLDITWTAMTMWLSLLLTAVLAVYLYIHLKSKRKSEKPVSDHEK